MSKTTVARALGVLSLVVFFVPLVAPFVQIATLLYVTLRGGLDRLSLAIGLGGAVGGFLLFLATEYVWIV